MRRRIALLSILVLGCPAPVTSLPDGGDHPSEEIDGGERPIEPGNSCNAAVRFDVPEDGGTLTLTGDASGFLDHASCENLSGRFGVGPDFLYRFATAAPMALIVDIDGGAVQFLPQDCVMSCPKFYDSPTPSLLRSHFKLPLREASNLVMAAEAAGPFSIQVRSRRLVRGDTCADPIVADLDGGSWVLETDLQDAFAERYLRLAPGFLAADLFLAVPVTAPSSIRATASSDAGVELWLSRPSDFCGDQLFQPTTSTASAELGPGTYFVGVGATAPGITGAPFDVATPIRVEVEVRPLPPGDSCSQPLPLVFSSDGGTEVATATGDTRLNVPGVAFNCGSRAANDAVLSFTLTAPRSVSALLTTTTPTYRPALGLVAGQCSGAAAACNLALVPGAGATVTGTALPAGTYFFWVGGADETNGTWTLNVSLTP